MDEQKKYEVIKHLADHPDASKGRAALTLSCTRRHINRMLDGYKKEGKAFFVHGNRGRQPATTIPPETRRLVNPQEVYVDLSDKLYKIKSELLEEMSMKALQLK